MVLDYRGAPPFKKPIQSITGIYSKPGATETTLRRIGWILFELDTDNIDSVREIMSKSGLKENTDWWLVKWSDEGLPDPSTWSEYVVKIKVGAGESKNIIVPTVPYTCIVHIKVYGSSNIKVSISSTGVGDFNYGISNVELIDEWGVISTTMSWHPRLFPRNAQITIENSGTSDEYVYIASIMVIQVPSSPIVTEIPLMNFRNCRVTGSNTTITFKVGIPISRISMIQMAAVVVSDGTNAVDVTMKITGPRYTIQVLSGSTTSTTGTAFIAYVPIKRKAYSNNVQGYGTAQILISSTGSITINEMFILLHVIDGIDISGIPKRVSGSYTSDGNGVTDTVTIIDLTTSNKHIKKLLRVYASGDANTTLLQLEVDGEVVWDFLKDGDTCTLDIEDVYKVVLLVNDNGSATTTSTTTVNYVVQYVEGEGVVIE